MIPIRKTFLREIRVVLKTIILLLSLYSITKQNNGAKGVSPKLKTSRCISGGTE